MNRHENGPRPPMQEVQRTEAVRETVSKADMQAIRQEVSLSATRSASGPGGQNVNKNAKTAELRWSPNDSSLLNDAEKQKITEWMQENKPSQFVGDSEIYITSTRTKSLEGNKKDVLKLLHQYLSEAFQPEVERKATKPSRAQRQRRLDDKKARGRLKKQRGRVQYY